jgi:hypothetical protein
VVVEAAVVVVLVLVVKVVLFVVVVVMVQPTSAENSDGLYEFSRYLRGSQASTITPEQCTSRHGMMRVSGPTRTECKHTRARQRWMQDLIVSHGSQGHMTRRTTQPQPLALWPNKPKANCRTAITQPRAQ